MSSGRQAKESGWYSVGVTVRGNCHEDLLKRSPCTAGQRSGHLFQSFSPPIVLSLSLCSFDVSTNVSIAETGDYLFTLLNRLELTVGKCSQLHSLHYLPLFNCICRCPQKRILLHCYSTEPPLLGGFYTANQVLDFFP